MAPEVSGRIVELNVLDNQQVKQGEVLFQIDPKPYQLSVDQARAAVQTLEAQPAVATSEVASQTSGAKAAATGINTAEAQLDLATSTLNRMQPLLSRGFVTAEQVDQARTAKETALIELERTRQTAAEAREAITSTKPTPSAAGRRAGGARDCRAQPQRDSGSLAMQRPDHRASGRRGGICGCGSSALHHHQHRALVRDRQFPRDRSRWDQARATRNCLRHGGTTPSTARNSRQPRLGVASSGSATFGGLPHVESTLNWVRIAARFPVRVLLDDPPEDLMRLGASAVIEIEK
jgi:multidrug efflux system membrane fusion protein